MGALPFCPFSLTNRNNKMIVNAQQLPALLTEVLKVGITPYIHGSPGLGKSDIVRQLAEQHNLEVIDVRLSQADPIDLNGLISFNKDKSKAQYTPLNTFPIEGDPLPEGKNGWICFLDEMASAPLSVQAAAFKLVLDRQVGEFNLHKRVAIVCAGNKATDGAIVNRISTPMQSRLAHFELAVSKDAWIEWADRSGIDHRIKSYISYKPDMLYRFDPKHNEYTFPCPRTWEFASKIIKGNEMTETSLILLTSVISEAAAREFYSYTRIFNSLPKLEDIVNNPDGAKVTNEPSVNYAVTGLLGHELTKDNAEPIMKYIARLPIEFQVLCVQSAVASKPELLQNDAVVEWKASHLSDLMT